MSCIRVVECDEVISEYLEKGQLKSWSVLLSGLYLRRVVLVACVGAEVGGFVLGRGHGHQSV
jgi:hypothetical protein